MARKIKRFTTLAMLALVSLLAVVLTGAASAQDPGTGASASKECPGVAAQLGQTITCGFVVQNIGAFPAQITALNEQSPFPGGSVNNITCTAAGVSKTVGDTLANDVPCAGTFQVTIPNDPALCGSFVLDRVTIELLYTNFPQPLIAGAFATHTTAVICPADISITKTADELSKIGDPVNYTFVLKNEGNATATRVSVNDTVLGDISASFPATLAAGASATVTLTRTVLASDPDPLVNTVTAIYSSGATQDTATATDSTNLFQPGVSVSKSCAPDPINVGASEACTIVVTNTGSPDSPGLVNGTISDSLTGNLLAAGNTAVTSSTCTAALATGASCTIVTGRTVLEADRPGPLVNTVTVHYNPAGFPNDITASASDSVAINPPPPTASPLTIGFWKTHAPASCKQGNGNQADALTPNIGNGIELGANYTETSACKLVQLLSKNNTAGVSQPGDPIFNMVAQLVGVELNINNGTSGTCDGIAAAITSAQNLLTAVHFNGLTHDALTATQASLASSLNTTFDSYNNGTLAGC